MDCLLVADDLTGACDAAVHFAIRGLSTTVPLIPGDHTARVVAVSTDSRDRSISEIRAALTATASQYPTLPTTRIFKKIDSTLRGNPGMEIVTAAELFGCDAAIVCPAYPRLHRVVTGGLLGVTGTPEFAPIPVATLLQSQSGCKWSHLIADELPGALASGGRFLSVDGFTDEDLLGIARAILGSNRRVLWAGSAGLACALAQSMSADSCRRDKQRRSSDVLFCIGSDHPVTLQQQAALLAHHPRAVHRIPRGLISPDEIRRAICSKAPAALVLSGGDTASLVCRALGVHAIELYDEIVSGVPRGILRGGDFDGLPVVTKSGAFGDPDTLIRVADYFACPAPIQTLNPPSL